MMLTDQSALCHEIYGAKSTERVYNVNKNHILCSIEKKRHTSGRQIFSVSLDGRQCRNSSGHIIT